MRALVEDKLEAPKHLARSVHDLYFEPKCEEFRERTIWSLSNAFTSSFKELDPIPQFKTTAKLEPGSMGRHCSKSDLWNHKQTASMARQKFGLRQFLSLEHIRVNYGEEGPGLIGDAIQKIGHRRKVGLIVPHLVTVPFLTAQSEMLGIVPLRLARALSPSLGLRILELPLELPPLTMSLVWHERHQHDEAHRWFRDFVAPNAVLP